jgi:heme/copper-type cytochrome/quinol oxidase subunit 2
MEDLAILVGSIFIFLIVLAIANVVLAILARHRRINFWVSASVNGFTALVALWAGGAAIALGVVPFISLVVASAILTWPRPPKED